MARDSARQAKEIELKLEFDPADAARLASHPALRAGPAPQEEHQLISTYFDTPDGALRKAGVYLRVRENGGHIVQTIKTAKSETDLIERLEWEREITSRNPDLDGIEDTPLKPLYPGLTPVCPCESLTTTLASSRKRETYSLSARCGKTVLMTQSFSRPEAPEAAR